jgi:cytochrome c-type biogenesis protein CcmF
MLAHAGVGAMVIGIVSTTAYQTEKVVALKPGEAVDVAGYFVTLQGLSPVTGPNYREERALFSVSRDGGAAFPLTPSKRFYTAREMATTEAAIRFVGPSQLYLSLGEAMPDGAVAVRASYKPLVTLIWIGPVIMALGGALSLSDRRLRIGAPRRARRPEPAAA